MNEVKLNTIGILSAGGGGGNSGNGGGGSNAVTPKRDGKTHFYIQIEETTVKKDITLPLYDTSGNSLIDWGDGTEPMQVSPFTGGNISHTYASGGYYEAIIYGSDTLKFTNNDYTGTTAYYRAAIYAIEIGSNVEASNVSQYPCLKDIYIINSGSVSLSNLPSLRDGHIMMEGVVRLSQQRSLGALTYFKPVVSIKSFGSYCFDTLQSLRCLDFSDFKEVPIAEGRLLNNLTWAWIKIVVPDNLYDEWINATNWSSDATRIIKKSDWDAQNA